MTWDVALQIVAVLAYAAAGWFLKGRLPLSPSPSPDPASPATPAAPTENPLLKLILDELRNLRILQQGPPPDPQQHAAFMVKVSPQVEVTPHTAQEKGP